MIVWWILSLVMAGYGILSVSPSMITVAALIAIISGVRAFNRGQPFWATFLGLTACVIFFGGGMLVLGLMALR